MKKVFKLLFIFLISFLFLNSIKAEDLVNFACEYDVQDIKIRIRVKDLPNSYLKSHQAFDNDNAAKKYVQVYYYDGSKYVDESKNRTLKVFDYTTTSVTTRQHIQNFIIYASQDANNIKCPTIYSFKDDSGTHISTTPSYNYYPYGSDMPETKSATPSTATSMKCYTSGSDNNPQTCDHVDVGKLIEDGEKECTYTANGKNRFKLIYNREKNTIVFDNMGTGISMMEGNYYENGKMYLNNGTLLAKFSNSSGCPKSINCNCSQGFGCYIYSSTKSSDPDCGNLVAEDGVSTDSKYNPDKDTGDANGEYHLEDKYFNIDDEVGTCNEILGNNLTNVVHAAVTILRIAAVVVTIVKGMMMLVPAITDKDAEGLKKVSGKLVMMAIILVVILILPYIVRVLGKILGFDITCLV